jgi:pterin-4a-carbinolamine dehydratase
LIPIIVSGASLPAGNVLPTSINALPSRQAIQIHDKSDINAILLLLEEHLGFQHLDKELDFPTPVDKSPKLSDVDLMNALSRLPGWIIEERESERGAGKIAVELVHTFKSSASRYVSKISHHPFWENQYKDLRVRITTWDVKMRITAKDIRLAEYLQWLYREYTRGDGAGDFNRPPE